MWVGERDRKRALSTDKDEGTRRAGTAAAKIVPLRRRGAFPRIVRELSLAPGSDASGRVREIGSAEPRLTGGDGLRAAVSREGDGVAEGSRTPYLRSHNPVLYLVSYGHH